MPATLSTSLLVHTTARNPNHPCCNSSHHIQPANVQFSNSLSTACQNSRHGYTHNNKTKHHLKARTIDCQHPPTAALCTTNVSIQILCMHSNFNTLLNTLPYALLPVGGVPAREPALAAAAALLGDLTEPPLAGVCVLASTVVAAD